MTTAQDKDNVFYGDMELFYVAQNSVCALEVTMTQQGCDSDCAASRRKLATSTQSTTSCTTTMAGCTVVIPASSTDQAGAASGFPVSNAVQVLPPPSPSNSASPNTPAGHKHTHALLGALAVVLAVAAAAFVTKRRRQTKQAAQATKDEVSNPIQAEMQVSGLEPAKGGL